MVDGGGVGMSPLDSEDITNLSKLIAGVFSGTGKIEVREITQQEMDEAKAQFNTGSTLTPDELEKFQSMPKGAPAKSKDKGPFRGLGSPPAMGLPLEPGIGKSTAIGTVEAIDD